MTNVFSVSKFTVLRNQLFPVLLTTTAPTWSESYRCSASSHCKPHARPADTCHSRSYFSAVTCWPHWRIDVMKPMYCSPLRVCCDCCRRARSADVWPRFVSHLEFYGFSNELNQMRGWKTIGLCKFVGECSKAPSWEWTA